MRQTGIDEGRRKRTTRFGSESEPGRDRAQVGIGTLVLFVAMVLVAAIAAGVLINTAGVLQSQAEATGQESTAQVSNSLEVYTTVGTVEDGVIDRVDVTVGLGPGSDPLDLDGVVINYIGPGGQDYLHVQPEDVTVDGGDGTVLRNSADRATITIDEFDEFARPLEADDDASLTIITGDGAQRTERLAVPSVLKDGTYTVRL